jgi:hypothetical protein
LASETTGLWDDPRLDADLDWDKVKEWVRQEREKVGHLRVEELRKLNEPERWKREEARAVRCARRAERHNLQRAACARDPDEEPSPPIEPWQPQFASEAVRSIDEEAGLTALHPPASDSGVAP